MPERKTVDYEHVARLQRQKLSAPQIAAAVGCNPRTIVRWRAANGLSQHSPSPHASYPISQERLDAARQMLDDGASRAQVIVTLHISDDTMKKYFPGRVFTPQQAGQIARMTRDLNRIPNRLR